MKAEEFKGKTADELKKALVDLKKKQFNMRFQRSQGQLENTAQIRAVRRDIARIKTFLTADKGGAVTPPPAKKKAESKSAASNKKAPKKPAKKAGDKDAA